MPTYTAWPTSQDVFDRLGAAGVTLRADASTDRVDAVLAAVESELEVGCQRQFVADTAVSARYFDGSGTPLLEIDDYIPASITAVALMGYSSIAASFSSWNELYDDGKPACVIALRRGTLPQLGLVYLDRFPQGSGNIKVTGKWGYAASIPAQVWEAVALEAAARLASEALFQPGYDSTTGEHSGRLSAWTDGGGVHEQYDLPDASKGLRWTAAFRACVALYKRPSGKRLRRLKAPMI